MNTSIVIVTYNGMRWLAKCLSSIPEKYEVIIVDNNSTDETVQFIQKYNREIILFKEPENLGFGQANNKGISYALNHGAESVFLLNQDAYLEPDTIDKLLTVQSLYPEYGILSPIHTNADKSRLDRNFSNYIRYDMNKDFYSDYVLKNPLKPVYEVPFVNAAGWLISKECLVTVGGFDPIFFHYGEDDNYCQRVIYHEFKIGVVPNSSMVHDRENREQQIYQPYTEPYFRAQERSLKVKYGNINDFKPNALVKEQEKLKKQLFKSRLRGKKESVNALKGMIRLVDKCIADITKSVDLNKQKQPNYLDISI